MALNRNEFEVLRMQAASKRDLAVDHLHYGNQICDEDRERAIASCAAAGFFEDGRITQKGREALVPYKVDNAVIMAAGLSSRFVPLSYEHPKGLLRVRGEVLIERQIEQLLTAGISDITVVVGYKKEYFFYLKEKYGVDIVVNDLFAERNNNWSVWLVRDRLRNTYLCSSDDYFIENPFEPYVYKAYYSTVFEAGETLEWCVYTDTCGAEDEIGDERNSAEGRITRVHIGGERAWAMLGHAYFDRQFSAQFINILKQDILKEETEPRLWEGIYADHVSELDMEARHFKDGIIYEFDNLSELEDFDPEFISNVDSAIFDNICRQLGCERTAIHDFYPIKNGLTNLSCHFTVGDKEYVYRHPGTGTDKIIDRKTELEANQAAAQLGVDKTFITMDPSEGWKLCYFVKNARNLDDHDPAQMSEGLTMIRKFHESGVTVDAHVDFFPDSKKWEKILEEQGPITIPGYFELREKCARLDAYSKDDGFPVVLCHNDLQAPNYVIGEDGQMSIIDWEYAGMADPYNDLGCFAMVSQFDSDETDGVLAYYLGRTPTECERRHFWSRVVMNGFYWYLWALVKEQLGAGVGEWLYIYYSFAADYVDRTLAWYDKAAAQGEIQKH